MASAELSALPPTGLTPGERLGVATAAIAGRLASLLDRALPGVDEGTSGREFLRAMSREAESAEDPWRAQERPHPLDRLAQAFRLSSVELDILFLAGLPDEHEGYSGILRTLHPRGEPRPTVGLAAQLFCADPDDRRLLRSILSSGNAVRAGIVRL